MKFSIIIPVYNSSLLAIRTISSVVENTSKSINYEVIVIDDCSDMKNRLLLDEFVKIIAKDININLHHTEVNIGPSAARNIGIEMSLGDYLCFLDSDDIWLGDKLSVLSKHLAGKDYAFVTHGFILDHNLRVNEPIYFPGWLSEDFGISYVLKYLNPFALSCLVVKKDIAYKVKFGNFRIGEDHLFMLECLKYGSASYCKGVYTLYHVNPEGQYSTYLVQSERINDYLMSLSAQSADSVDLRYKLKISLGKLRLSYLERLRILSLKVLFRVYRSITSILVS